MVELRKRPAPPPAPPKAKKAATGKAKGKKGAAAVEKAPKETKPPATNPADDPKGGLPEGSGGLSVTAGIKTAQDANVTAAKVEADAVKDISKKTAKGGSTEAPKEGESITLEGFGGEVETNDGERTSLVKLVEASEAGVVLFTYPKASTPGCKCMRQYLNGRVFCGHGRHTRASPFCPVGFGQRCRTARVPLTTSIWI